MIGIHSHVGIDCVYTFPLMPLTTKYIFKTEYLSSVRALSKCITCGLESIMVDSLTILTYRSFLEASVDEFK